eukprot:4957127-Pleurochrysis_carterae.AAC.1
MHKHTRTHIHRNIHAHKSGRARQHTHARAHRERVERGARATERADRRVCHERAASERERNQARGGRGQAPARQLAAALELQRLEARARLQECRNPPVGELSTAREIEVRERAREPCEWT